MHLDGVEPRQLVMLHGELLAFGWLEQNTGSTRVLKAGAVAACYRVTAAGLRALRHARDGDQDEDERLTEAAERGCPAQGAAGTQEGQGRAAGAGRRSRVLSASYRLLARFSLHAHRRWRVAQLLRPCPTGLRPPEARPGRPGLARGDDERPADGLVRRPEPEGRRGERPRRLPQRHRQPVLLLLQRRQRTDPGDHRETPDGLSHPTGPAQPRWVRRWPRPPRRPSLIPSGE